MYTLLYLLCLVELGLGCYMRAFSLVVDTRGYSLLQSEGFSFRWFLLLGSIGFRACGLQ